MRAPTRRLIGGYLLACVAAALAPAVADRSGAAAEALADRFPGWPRELDGQPLEPLPLTAAEVRFERGFPGRIGRFAAGPREVVLRWVAVDTRKLHPVADCLRASGYALAKPRVEVDANGRWGCVGARRSGVHLDVCEQIRSLDGGRWSDVSAWYWDAVRGRSIGPWWAISVATALPVGE